MQSPQTRAGDNSRVRCLENVTFFFLSFFLVSTLPPSEIFQFRSLDDKAYEYQKKKTPPWNLPSGFSRRTALPHPRGPTDVRFLQKQG